MHVDLSSSYDYEGKLPPHLLGESNAIDGLHLPSSEWSTFVPLEKVGPINFEGLHDWEGYMETLGLCIPQVGLSQPYVHISQ